MKGDERAVIWCSLSLTPRHLLTPCLSHCYYPHLNAILLSVVSVRMVVMAQKLTSIFTLSSLSLLSCKTIFFSHFPPRRGWQSVKEHQLGHHQLQIDIFRWFWEERRKNLFRVFSPKSHFLIFQKTLVIRYVMLRKSCPVFWLDYF